MTSLSLGDLAHSYMLQRRSVSVRQSLTQLTEELSSGRVSDIRKVLDGNHSYLTDIERSLGVLSGYSVSNAESAQLTGAMQFSLDRAQEITSKLGVDMITAGNGSVAVISGTPSKNAEVQLKGLVSIFNGDIAGRSMFAGTATDQAPLASADTLLAELRSVVAGQSTPAAMMAAAQAWFDDPGGFEALIYLGSTNAIAPFKLSEREQVSVDIRADNPAFRTVLRHTAMAALAQDSGLGLSLEEQSEMFMMTGLGLQSSQDQLTAVRSGLGFAEARIETVASRNAAEQTSLEFARTALLAADPFETATKLEEVQFQLQSLYAVTARTSQLSLVNFL